MPVRLAGDRFDAPANGPNAENLVQGRIVDDLRLVLGAHRSLLNKLVADHHRRQGKHQGQRQ